MSDLVERLQSYVNVAEAMDDDWKDCVRVQDLREAIAALSAPTSEEVQAMIDDVMHTEGLLQQLVALSNKYGVHDGDHIKNGSCLVRAAGLIERQARTVELQELGVADAEREIESKQQRIEELEVSLSGWTQTANQYRKLYHETCADICAANGRAERAEQQRDEALRVLADCPRIVEQDEGDEWGFSVDSDDLRGYCKKHVARIRAMGDKSK